MRPGCRISSKGRSWRPSHQIFAKFYQRPGDAKKRRRRQRIQQVHRNRLPFNMRNLHLMKRRRQARFTRASLGGWKVAFKSKNNQKEAIPHQENIKTPWRRSARQSFQAWPTRRQNAPPAGLARHLFCRTTRAFPKKLPPPIADSPRDSGRLALLPFPADNSLAPVAYMGTAINRAADPWLKPLALCVTN